MVRVLVARSAGVNSMYVTNEAGKRFPLYMAPTTFEHSEVAKFGTVEREGLKPITTMTGPSFRTLSFSHRIGSLDYRASIEHVLLPLTDLAKRGQKVRFVGGSSAYEQSVWWRILDLPVKVEQRAADNRISRAVLSWTLEEAGSLPPNLIRSLPKPAPPKPVVKKAAATRTHRVVRGDTLWWLASRYLGNPLRWPELYRANSNLIRNPNLILIGWVLKIPPR
jgi:LysM repeat protein